MLRTLLRQDFSQRFTGNLLGLAWAVLIPLMQLALFALVFVHIFNARMPDLGEGGYVLFLALGMWPWFAFAEAVGRGTTALTDSAGLLGKVAISTWQLVLARVLSAFVVHGIGFIVVILVLAVWHGGLWLQFLPAALPSWLVLMALATAIAQVAAVANVFARDVQQVVPYLLNAWMFLTPILYDRAALPAWLGEWMRWNPLTSVIEGIRGPLLAGTLDATVPWLGAAAALLALLLSAAISRRFRPFVREFL